MKSKAVKAAKSANNRTEGKQAIKAHQQVRKAIETLGTKPDALSEMPKNGKREGAEYLSWLESMPDSANAPGDMTVQLDVELSPNNWIQLAQFAAKWDISIESAVFSILSRSFDNDEPEKMSFLYGMEPGPKAKVAR